jgi:hypothetical protein
VEWIADENHLDDPLWLPPGTILSLPVINA